MYFTPFFLTTFCFKYIICPLVNATSVCVFTSYFVSLVKKKYLKTSSDYKTKDISSIPKCFNSAAVHQ